MQKQKMHSIRLVDIVVDAINAIQFTKEPSREYIGVLMGILGDALEKLFYVSATKHMTSKQYKDYLAVSEENPDLSTVESLLIALEAADDVKVAIMTDIDVFVDDFIKIAERNNKLRFAAL